MKTQILTFALLITFYVFAKAQNTPFGKFIEHVKYLSSAELEGRFPGTVGDSLAFTYIANQFKEAGLQSFESNYLQHFTVLGGCLSGNNNRFIFNNDTFKVRKDYFPISFTIDTSLTASVAYVGYGLESKKEDFSYTNYQGVDVKNKWLIMLYDIPENIESKVGTQAMIRLRTIQAREKGAAGVIFIYNKDTELPGTMYDKSSQRSGIPAVMIDLASAEKIFGKKNIAIIKANPGKTGKIKPIDFESKISITTDVDFVEAKTTNVIGYKKGNHPELQNEYIVIGGHYDHLGMGGPGSGSRKPDVRDIHYGADDNASGTAGIIELAHYFKNIETNRSLIFVAFGAEEQGLLGSKHFCENPPVPLKNINSMINFDMIGRMKTQSPSLNISGVGTALEFDSLLKINHDTTQFQLKLNAASGGGSDHASFYKKNIPVLFFITGMHDDYHTPADTWDKINIEGAEKVLQFASKSVKNLADINKNLTYKQMASENSNNRHGGTLSLGIIPDVAGSDAQGLLVEGVKKGGPADKAGILKNDIITSINGKPVKGIYDYMNALQSLQKNKKNTVIVKRTENAVQRKIVLKVEL